MMNQDRIKKRSKDSIRKEIDIATQNILYYYTVIEKIRERSEQHACRLNLLFINIYRLNHEEKLELIKYCDQNLDCLYSSIKKITDLNIEMENSYSKTKGSRIELAIFLNKIIKNAQSARDVINRSLGYLIYPPTKSE